MDQFKIIRGTTKTINVVSAELQDLRYFTVIDAKVDYWMVYLDFQS